MGGAGNKTYQIDVLEGGKVNKVTILGNINLLLWILKLLLKKIKNTLLNQCICALVRRVDTT